MAEIGVYYIHIAPEMKGFTSEVRSALGDLGTSAGNSFSGSFMDVLKGSAIGTLVGNLATQLGGQIMSGIDVGIRRIDTLENFPKVMEALGYTSEEAATSVQTIMKHLDGLPTTTQDMVTLTKAIADSTGDLDLATRAALGFNDMMLANGSTTGEMTQAMGVFNRVLGKQNATVAQWQSLQSVMPAQLAMVARELQGEGASVEGLRDALNDGTISWNDFLRAIVKLDEEGSGSVASFTEQAIANSHGIETSLTNVPNRIGQGWANILGAIGREDISGTIDKMSYGIRDAMTRVADGITYLKEKIGNTAIFQNLSTIFGKISDVFSGLGGEAAGGLQTLADKLVELTDGGLQWIVDHGDLVTTLTWGMLGALAALSGWQIGTGLAALPGILTGIWTAIMANPFGLLVGAISVAVAALYGFFTQTEVGQQIWENFTTIVSELWTGLQEDFENLCTTIQTNIETASAVWSTFKTNLVTWNEEIRSKVLNKWQQIKDGITSEVNRIKTQVPQNLNALRTSIVTWNENVRSNFLSKWQAIKNGVTAEVTRLKTDVPARLSELRLSLVTWNDNVRSDMLNKWESIKTTITTKVTALKTDAMGKFNQMRTDIVTWNESVRSDVLAKWEAIKEAISKPINAAKDAVQGAIDRIKQILNTSLSFPHIKTPHFNITGGEIPWGIGGKGTAPSISIDWYAKGGVFDSATLIGIGEKGKEAALPLNDRTYGEIASGIAGKMDGGGIVINIDKMVVREEADIDRIAEKLAVKARREGRAA